MTDINAFTSLSFNDCAQLPAALQVSWAEHWSKSKSDLDKNRARALLPLLPNIAGSSISKPSLGVALRCVDDEAVLAWLDQAKHDLQNSKAIGWNPARPLGDADWAAEATLAMRREKTRSARLLLVHSTQIFKKLSITQKDGSRVSLGFASEALRLRQYELLEYAYSKLANPKDRAPWLIENRTDFDARSANPSERLHAIEDNWVLIRPLLSGEAGERLHKELVNQMHHHDDLVESLVYCVDKNIRDDFDDLTQGVVKKLWLDRHAQTEKEGWGWVEAVLKTRDDVLIDEVLAKAPLQTWVGRPSYRLLAMDIIDHGGAAGVRGVEKACLARDGRRDRGGLLGRIFTESDWVWTNPRNTRERKKGDALAYCVAQGNQDAAEAILNAMPKADCSYARALAKYCESRSSVIEGQATAAWEKILLSKMKGPEESELKNENVQTPIKKQASRL